MKIGIIGAGASGLMAAITASSMGAEVKIFEYRERAGKKILVTGNGKCNFTNRVQEASCYRSENPGFPKKVLNAFDLEKTLSFFEDIGVEPKEKNGYFYPNSGQSASVSDLLVLKAKFNGVKISFALVTKVEKKEDMFWVTAKGENGKECKESFNRVIISLGSPAGFNKPSDFNGYNLVEELGHKLVTPVPALVQLKCKEKWVRKLFGVRCEAGIVLRNFEEKIASEEGEVIFTETGISGIPVFQISRFASRLLKDKNIETQLVVDFFPKLCKNELSKKISKRIASCKGKTCIETMTGLLNDRLLRVLMNNSGINPDDPAEHAFSETKTYLLTENMKGMLLCVNGTNDFSSAQVSAGGVDTKYVNDETLESLILPGLYFSGEILDVDGTCGGYNLQWAWSSGYVAGHSAAGEQE